MRFKLLIIWNLIKIRLHKWWYRNNLAQLRAIYFKQLLKRCAKAPFYKEIAAQATDISDFPIINKQLFMQNFEGMNSKGIQLEKALQVALEAEESRDFSPTIGPITVGLSSGTSGNRGVFLANEKERAIWVAAVLDRVIGFSFKKRSVAFFLRANSNIYDSAKSGRLSFNFFDIFIPIEAHIQRLNALQPTIIVAQPSVLKLLAKAQEAKTLQIAPSKVISVAEVLTTEDRAYLAEVFQQKIHQVYQCTEGFLGYTCPEGTLHFNEDFLIIEKRYIDTEKKRFHPIITDLKRESQLVIRYELNDIILEKEKPCPCESKMMAVEAIEGRSDDILQFKNQKGELVSIFPDFFRRAIISSSETIEEYALVQDMEQSIALFIQSKNSRDFFVASERIYNLLLQYEIQDIEILRLSQYPHSLGQKLRRIQNGTQKTL